MIIKHQYKILDCRTGRVICLIEAKTERGAKMIFRRDYLLEHNYPVIVAVKGTAIRNKILNQQ